MRELEQECAEKELQCITLRDRMEKLCEAGIAFDNSFTSSLNENGILDDPGVSIDDRQPDGEEDRQGKQKLLVSRTSTDTMISALEDTESDTECMSGRTSSLSGFALRRESMGDESVSIDESQKEDTTQEMPSEPRVERKAVLAVSNLSDTLGSLKDEFMAVGEKVESDYDTYSSDDDEEESGVGRKNSGVERKNSKDLGDIRPPDPDVSRNGEIMPHGESGSDHDTSDVSLAKEATDSQAEENRRAFDDENVLELLDSMGEVDTKIGEVCLVCV